jgi:hypothetical protein
VLVTIFPARGEEEEEHHTAPFTLKILSFFDLKLFTAHCGNKKCILSALNTL